METEKVRFTTYVPKTLKKAVVALSAETRVPQSRLFEEAVEDLLKKYEEAAEKENANK